MTVTEDDDLTEMASLDVSRVDAVKGAANGRPLLLMKGIAPVVKDLGDDMTDTMDPTMPGSAGWEANDAMRGADIAAMLAAACSKLDDAIASEAAEVATGNADDSMDVWCLEDAMSCLDSALAIVARFAVTEAQEAGDATADDGVAKAGARLSKESMAHATAARDHLTALIGDKKTDASDGDKTDADDSADDGDDAVTKELESLVASIPELIASEVAKAIAANAPAPAVEEMAPTDATDDVAKGTGEDAPVASGAAEAPQAEASAPEAVSKATVEAVVKEQLAPLTTLLEQIAAQPAAGGPIVGPGGNPQLPTLNSPADVTKAIQAAVTDPQAADDLAMQFAQRTLAGHYTHG